jgi:hypothetical protein
MIEDCSLASSDFLSTVGLSRCNDRTDLASFDPLEDTAKF